MIGQLSLGKEKVLYYRMFIFDFAYHARFKVLSYIYFIVFHSGIYLCVRVKLGVLSSVIYMLYIC